MPRPFPEFTLWSTPPHLIDLDCHAKRTMRALSQQCCLLQLKHPLVHFYLLFGLICAGVTTEIIALGCSHSASRPTLVWWACGSEYNPTLSQVQRALDIVGVADPLQPAALRLMAVIIMIALALLLVRSICAAATFVRLLHMTWSNTLFSRFHLFN